MTTPHERGFLVGKLRALARPVRGAAIFVHSRLDRLVAYREDGALVDLEEFWRLGQSGALGDMPLRSGTRFVSMPAPWLTTTAATVQTTDATVTTCGSFTVADGRVSVIEAWIAGRKDDGTQGAGYRIAGVFRRSAGVVTQIGTTAAAFIREDDVGWDAALTISSTSVLCNVTGAAGDTVDWRTRLTLMSAP